MAISHCKQENCLTLFQKTILNLTKLKSIADNEFHVAKARIFTFNRLENIVGKGN